MPESKLAVALRAAARAGMTLRELHQLYLDTALAQHGGNKLRAARALGINRRTLYRHASGYLPDEPSTQPQETV